MMEATIETFVACVFFTSIAHTLGSTTEIQNCDSLQYVEKGKTGIIECSFESGFFGVYWYNSTDYVDSYPIIYVSDSVKYGTGYASGKYDIYPNGSLLIQNVTLEHEHSFTVTYLQSLGEKTVTQEIQVVVVVKPSLPYPYIHNCDDESNGCFVEVNKSNVLECSVSGSRPAVGLRWLLRTADEYINVTSNSSTTSSGYDVYTTRITSRQKLQNPSLLLFVCKADSPPRLILEDVSYVLTQTGSMNISSVHRKAVTVDRFSSMNLKCTHNHFTYLVWKRGVSSKTESKTLLYAIVLEKNMEKTFEEGFFLGESGSLVVPQINVEHEGEYGCFYSDGITEGVTAYEITVRVSPVPALPVVDGCDHQPHCVLDVGYNGILTCHVTGIRPRAQLKWSTLHAADADLISFTNQQLETTENGDTFNIKLSATYQAKPTSGRKLTVACTVIGPSAETFNLNRVIDMLFLSGQSTEGTSPPTQPTTSLWWIIMIVAFIVVFFIVSGVLIKKHMRKREESQKRAELGTDEMTEMLPKTRTDLENSREFEDLFVNQLKEKYKDLYNAIKPIPHEKDTLYQIEQVFVESDIQFLDSNTNAGNSSKWKKINTYQNILDDTRLKSKTCIVEGDPGYGKTMLTLKLAYDWCNSISTSPLKEVRILILLQLGQLRGVRSIYKAIREFLLPNDSTLGEQEIKNIVAGTSSSLLIVLDGFDEYPDRHDRTDILDIVSKEIFQDSHVIVTTRTGVLPKKYPALQTARVRLNGFHDDTSEHYIRKAIVNDNDQNAKEVIARLRESSETEEFCKIPMCFVMIAHMTHKSDNFRNLHSITSFLCFIVSGILGHVRNKTDDADKQCLMFETEHRRLNEMAFNGLLSGSRSRVWRKEEVCEQVGHDIYELYRRSGILVEEEKRIDKLYGDGNQLAKQNRHQTNVKFYHNVFCHWYAAHYVADYFKEHSQVNLNELLKSLNPSDLYNVCRFACGLNPACAAEIIRFVNHTKNGDILAILCISESMNNFDGMRETIRDLCNGSIVISSSDSLFLQQSSIKLLDLSLQEGIPINYVILHNCLESFDFSRGILTTKSGLSISSKIQIRWLQIEVAERELPDTDAKHILDFAAICPHLQNLWYYGCVPCRSFDPESSSFLSLKSKQVTVTWRAFEYTPIYNLNFSTGRWENAENGAEPSSNEFEKMLFQRAQRRRKMTEVSYRENAEITREYWRKKAAKDIDLH